MPPSFAQEIASANASRGEAPVAPPTEVSPAPETAEQHFSMPEHGDAHPEQADAPDAGAPEAPPANPTPQRDGKIRIGTEVFDSVEDAMLYASELQTTIVQKDAFELGKQSVTQTETPAPAPDWTEEIEQMIFENPKEAIRKIHEKAIADAEKMLDQKEEKKAEAQRIEIQRQTTWKGFYEANADLSTAAAQEIVKGILQRDWKELGPMTSEKALPLLAERSRLFIRSLKETQLPSSVLQSGKTLTTASTNGATPQVVKKTSSALDFISQVNKHRKRTDTK